MPFQLDNIPVTEALQRLLESGMAAFIERNRIAETVFRRMGRIQMRARHQPARNVFGRGMGAAVTQQVLQNVRMGPLGTPAVRRRNGLKYFGTADPAQENPVW